MAMGPPLGNKNAAKSRMFSDALRKAIIQRDLEIGEEGATLARICRQWILKAERDEGSLEAGGVREALAASKEIRNTLEGTPSQRVELTGADDGPVQSLVRVVFVKPEDESE